MWQKGKEPEKNEAGEAEDSGFVKDSGPYLKSSEELPKGI